jgi:hypothetical protein
MLPPGILDNGINYHRAQCVFTGGFEATMNISRGILRVWIVVSVGWIGFTGYYQYFSKPWNLDWGDSHLRTEGECWDKIAKWPDGRPFQWFDLDLEADIPQNNESLRKQSAWSAGDIAKRNRWAETVRERLAECEASEPLLPQGLIAKVGRVFSSLYDGLGILLLPPIAILILGLILRWVIQGFAQGKSPTRPTKDEGAQGQR